MKRTRRAALAMLAGSSSLLAIETLGFSSVEAGREMSVDVAPDSEAYLSLIEDEDGVETSDVLFGDGESRVAPATFDVKNQLTEPMAVVLESDAFEFEPVDDDGRVLGDDGRDLGDDPELEVGERVEVTVDLATIPDGEHEVRDTIEIRAEGASTTIEAERPLRLTPPVSELEFSLCRGESENCVAVALELTRVGGEVDIVLTESPPDDDETTHQDRTETGASATFDLDFEAYGSSEAGNWTVERAQAGSDADEKENPGDAVTIESDGVSVTVDSAASGGPDEQVQVTVSVDEADD